MSVKIDLPGTPSVGQRFRPDTTDSIGTITAVRGREVEYSYEHAPESVYTRPYLEVRRMAWAA